MLKLIEFTSKNIFYTLILTILPVCVFGQVSLDPYANTSKDSMKIECGSEGAKAFDDLNDFFYQEDKKVCRLTAASLWKKDGAILI